MDMFLLGIALIGGIFIGDRIAVIRSKLFAPPSPEGSTYVVSGQHLQPVEPSTPSSKLGFITMILLIGLGLVLAAIVL